MLGILILLGSEDNNLMEGDDCSIDLYNCGNFPSQNAAQTMFDQCGGVDNDIHQLDKDGDGVVCESLG